MPYTEKGSVEPLKEGKTVQVKGSGNSMTPRLKNGQVVTVHPVTKDTVLRKNDVVIVKVRGNTYMHKILAIKGDEVLIGNNHGRVNGWTSRDNVFGWADA